MYKLLELLSEFSKITGHNINIKSKNQFYSYKLTSAK